MVYLLKMNHPSLQPPPCLCGESSPTFSFIPFEPTLGLGTSTFGMTTLATIVFAKCEIIFHTHCHFHDFMVNVLDLNIFMVKVPKRIM